VKRTSVGWLLLVLAFLLVAATAEAQRRGRSAAPGPRYGGHVGYNFDVEDVLLGAQVSWPVTPRIDLYPSLDYYLVDPGSLWSLNLDVKFRPPSRQALLYFGAGLNYSRRSVSGNGASDTGLNLLLGYERRLRTAPYLEAKIILGDGSSFQIVGGLSFH
jgi:hypothetical protein